MNLKNPSRREFLQIAGVISAEALFLNGCGGSDERRSTLVPSPTPVPIPESSEVISKTGLYVEENKIYKDGEETILRGVAVPSLEWYRQEWGYESILNDETFISLSEYGFNVIRLPINQKSVLEDENYNKKLNYIIRLINNLGMAVIVDMHRSEGSSTAVPYENVKQYCLPDERTLKAWQHLAESYKDYPNVLFELYNEPRDASSNEWLKGGHITCDVEGKEFEYKAIGMQDLVNTVRATGSENVLILNGLDWGIDFRNLYIPQEKNIVLGVHPYKIPQVTHKDEPSEWNKLFGFLKEQYPIFITEFGHVEECNNPNFYKDVVTYAEENGFSWAGWAWYPADCSFPALIDRSGNLTGSGKYLVEYVQKN